jgi:hypothetical protein
VLKFFFILRFVIFFYSADALLSMEICQPESKKTAVARQQQDEMRPDTESAADGQRPASHHADRERSAPASKDNLTPSFTGKGNI